MEETLRLTKSIEKLIDRLEAEKQNLTSLKAIELVENANIQQEDLLPFADFDYPLEDCYGRNMVYDAGSFELMVMTWRPRNYSAIHDHGYTHWGVVKTFHSAHHNIFRLRDNVLSIAKQEIVPANSCIPVSNHLIHQMGNPTTEAYISMHLYGSHERSECVTADSKIYELEKQRIAHTTGGAFINLAEQELYDFQGELSCDLNTKFYYAGILLDYYARQEQNESFLKKKEKLLEWLAV